MGFFEKAKKYIKEAFEKYGDVANPGGFVGRPTEPAEAKAEPEKADTAKADLAEKLRGVKKEEKKPSMFEEAKKLYAIYGANPGGMIEKPMKETEAKKAEPKDGVTAKVIAAQKRNNGR